MAVRIESGAKRALLAELIDDAGLFPPARLGMPDALAAHARGQADAEHWMLGRFLCPASRLAELVTALPPELEPLRLSVVFDGTPEEGLAHARELGHSAEGRLHLELLELKLPDSPDEFVRAAGPGPATFFEVPADGPLAGAVAAIAAAGAGAKLRCGGLAPEAFPSPERAAEFIELCLAHRVRFKATAGLHHPIRGVEPKSGLLMHGFLNLLFATVLLAAGSLAEDELGDVIADEDAGAFELSDEALSWCGRTATVGEVSAARRDLFVAYGSCSFSEPVEDLRALGILS